MIRKRFDEQTISKFLNMEWWNWSHDKIKQNLEAIMNGDIEKLR